MILLVDDDPSVRMSLGLLLKQHGHPSLAATGPEEAVSLLASQRFDLVLQDMNFSRDTSGQEGLQLLRRIKTIDPEIPVILITAWRAVPLAVEGMKAGASDFLTKPWANSHLIQSVETVLKLAESARQESSVPQPQRAELDAHHEFGALIGEDPAFLKVLALIGRVAPTDASVLIAGESGTGKELVATAIHRNSPRRERPFVKVNLGGISSTLFESEMFGHLRGAFTDARADRKGRFEVADGGTIFLDEIGDLDPNSQVKLLRVLQDRTFEVLGSSVSRTVDVRVISATHHDLLQEVIQGRFREDLLYRLNLITIRLPALRERRTDIPLLARRFLKDCGTRYQRPDIGLTKDALRWLQAREWPGNVRQLRQTIERAALVVEEDQIEARHLTALAELEAERQRPDVIPPPGSMTIEDMERAMIVRCMRHFEGNVSKVAEALGLSRAALYRRLEKYGLE